MKKDIIKSLFLMSLPLFLAIFVGFLFLFSDVYDGPTKTITGEITLFDKGSHRRYGSTPMHIEIDDETYIITGGVRWATDFTELKEALAVGNIVTIEFYEELNMNYVVGIEFKDTVLVTKTEFIEGQNQQNKLKSTIAFYIAYTYLLIEIMVVLALSKKFAFEFNLGYLNKVILNKCKFILNIIITILLIVGSFAVIAINKWFYLPLITISLVYLFYTFILKDKLYFGTGGFRILISCKKKHYSWNSIRELIELNHNNKKIVILNFKDNYCYKGTNVKEYLKLAKAQNDKFVYVLHLSKNNLKEFDKLKKKYYINKHKQ